ncbi:hypothetical protein [Parabacteroides sp.]
MKRMHLLFVLLVFLMTSCGDDRLVILDNPTFTVSSETVRNGDKMTLRLEPGEQTNVELEVVFSWEGKEIGCMNHYPYQVEYVVDGIEPGFHIITCTASYAKKGGGIQSSGSVVKSILVQVVE